MPLALLPLTLVLLLLLPTGCGSPQRSDTVRGSDGSIRDWVTDDQLVLRRYDSSGDGQSDVFRYLAVLDEEGERMPHIEDLQRSDLKRTRLVRLEMDLNGDGEIDVLREYDERENLLRELVTSSVIGQRTLEHLFQDGVLVTRRVDRNGDGHFEETWHYRNGALQRVEFDIEAQGHTSLWHYYRDDILVRIGRDLTGDGVIDQWQVLQAESGDFELRQRQGPASR